MTEFVIEKIKDLGLMREVTEMLPYAVVGGTYMGSFQMPLGPTAYMTLLNHIVPTGLQLKILFLRIWTQDNAGAVYSIVQTNPTALGQTGTTEAFPVVGSVPQGVRDYPMLEAPGAEILHGGMHDPIHVLEGSIDFRLHGPIATSGDKFGLAWWGVQKSSE